MLLRIDAAALLAAGLVLAPIASAQDAAGVESIFDRVPADAGVVVAIANVGEFREDLRALITQLGEDPDMLLEDAPFRSFFTGPGIDQASPAAIAVVFGEDFDPDFDEPEAYFLIPVTDYKALAESMGGTAEGVSEVMMNEWESGFLRNLGNGYAVMGVERELVAAYEGGGNGMASLLGRAGRESFNKNDISLVASIEACLPFLDRMQEDMEMGVMMAGPEAEGGEKVIAGLFDRVREDGQSFIMGGAWSEDGIRFEQGVVFSEGSVSGKFFQAVGKTAPLLGRLPASPYLLAGAYDTSSQEMRQLFAGITKFVSDATQLDEEAGEAMDMAGMMDQTDGGAFLLGTPPALMGVGLLGESIMYVATEEPAKFRDRYMEAYEMLDGKEIAGIRYESSYDIAVQEIEGETVDGYTMHMSAADPEMGMMFDPMMMAMAGPGGMNGYIATGTSGLLVTLSKNTSVMARAIKAAKGEVPAFGSDARVQSVSAQLPEGRIGEGYLNVRDIATLAMPIANAQMGLDLRVPRELSPIGFALTARNSSCLMTCVLPADVIDFIRQGVEAGRAMRPAPMPMMDEDENAEF